jgi:hypothetical protein
LLLAVVFSLPQIKSLVGIVETVLKRLNPPWRPCIGQDRKGDIDTGGYITIQMPLIKHIISITWILKHIAT